ncbi:MAG: HAMP domain-containing sensor histidine kinase [Formivibrio sp.]|nr:HAMP domain-containing sensor histidine kinase [Formivibrio sp.]
MTGPMRELTLTELLTPQHFARLGETLATLLPGPIAFEDAQHALLWGKTSAQAGRQALTVELEPIGYLLADAEPEKLAAAAILINELLAARWRYLASSQLHDEVIDADFEALQASEARYKALSEELEQRVQEQLAMLEARQRQLYESARFAAIGQLAAGVAHEINTPLGFMRSNLNTLAHYLGTLAQLKNQSGNLPEFWQQHDLDYVLQDSHDLLTDCIAGTARVERIVGDLRGFACLDSPEMEMVDPAQCLGRAISMINMQKPAEVNLESDLTPLPAMACQTGRLSQALLNILNNAVQAVESGGDIRVSSKIDSAGRLITIQDNGPGMDPECLSQVFEPFFTTRPVGSGTGLGLTVARDTIEAHAGQIEIESRSGQGTLVKIRFPS